MPVNFGRSIFGNLAFILLFCEDGDEDGGGAVDGSVPSKNVSASKRALSAESDHSAPLAWSASTQSSDIKAHTSLSFAIKSSRILVNSVTNRLIAILFSDVTAAFSLLIVFVI